MNINLPQRTVARLSEYRRILLDCLAHDKTYIYSHELASLNHITAVQVRRDMMLMGFTSLLRKGYDIRDLIDAIGRLIDTPDGLNVAVIGLGNLGRAITGYFQGKRPNLNIVAAFDNEPAKIGKDFVGIKCYAIDEMPKVLQEKMIRIAILTVPPDQAKKMADLLAGYGIRGILNFTTAPLNMPPSVFLEEYDMITSMEKVAYFVKKYGSESKSK